MLQRSGRNEEQIRELKRKANIIMEVVWGIGKRKFRDNFKRRMQAFSDRSSNVSGGDMGMERKRRTRKDTKEK